MRKVFIGVTSYTGMMDAACCAAVLVNCRDLDRAGYLAELSFEIGNCYIPDARNKLIHRFLATGADYFIFVDADLSFDADTFRKLVEAGKDVCGVAYPFKVGDEGYPVNIFTKENGTPDVDESGCIRARIVPTGLMCIRRQTLETLRERHPEWQGSSECVWFFDTGRLFPGDLDWYGEDVAFCKRVRDDGMSVWVLPDVTVSHVGRAARTGNYHQFLLSCPRPKE